MAARAKIETVAFDSGDLDPVVAQMRRLSDGVEGWINIGPGLRDDQIEKLPEPTLFGRLFSGRGPIVPMATWTPPADSAGAAIGIEHGAGPRALDQLRDAGVPLPSGWRKVQDHAKNGIVVEPSAAAAHEDVLKWMLTACWSLCGIEIDDHWLAEVHTP